MSTTPDAQPTIGINNPGNLAPTPTAPAYLVGAYVNNSTITSTSGSVTIYVIFHHGQYPQAGGQVSLYFHYEDGGALSELNDQAETQTTGTDGYATFQVYFNDLPLDMPISIDVTVHFTGIADIIEKDATSFSVVNLIPTATPTPRRPPGG